MVRPDFLPTTLIFTSGDDLITVMVFAAHDGADCGVGADTNDSAYADGIATYS